MPFTTNVTVSPTLIPGAFNLNCPESSSVEVTNVWPFFLIWIVEDGVAYPVTNPESATTIPNCPRFVSLSIGTDLRPVPSPILWPLRGSWEPEVKRVVAFLTELNIRFTSLFICSTSVRDTVVFSRTPWANPNSSLAFSRTSLLVSCAGNSRTAAFNWSTDTFKESFLANTVWFSSLALTSEETALATMAPWFSVLSTWTSLDSLEAADKTVTSLDKSSTSSSISFWTSSELSRASFPFWNLSLIGETTELSRFNLVERREFTSSTTFFNLALSTVIALFATIAVSLFSKELLATSTLFSVGSVISRGESASFLGLTTPAVDGEPLSLTLFALTTRVPKNISAATATEAAPKLYLRIEKRKTFSRWWRFTLYEFDLCSISPPKENILKKQSL